VNVEMPMGIIWGLVGYILITTGGFIWWAATQTADMKTLKDLVNKLINSDGLYARKASSILPSSTANRSHPMTLQDATNAFKYPKNAGNHTIDISIQ